MSILTNLKKRLFKKPQFKVNKFTTIILLIPLVIMLTVWGLAVYETTWAYAWNYLKINVIQLVIIFFVGIVIFYNSYKRSMRRTPSRNLMITYTGLSCILLLTVIAIPITIEQLSNRGSFSIGGYLFTNLALIFSMISLASYDLPFLDNEKEMYLGAKNNFFRNLGLFLALFFVVALIGLMNRAFLYAVSALVVLVQLYLLKSALSNLRK